MFEEYRAIIAPKNGLKDVIDDRVLRKLMQSFYLGEKHELLMLRFAADGSPERFSSFEGDDRRYFNPFCREFRRDRACDELCESCDLRMAKSLLNNHASSGVFEYRCHMRLIDCAYPVKMAGKTCAVLFAGQRIPVWNKDSVQQIKEQIRDKAPDRYAELARLVDGESPPTGKPSINDLETLKLRFQELGETIQVAVTACYDALHARAIKNALEEVVEHLSSADIRSQWMLPINDVLQGLEELLAGSPILLLVKDRGAYVGKAASPGAEHQIGVRFEAAELEDFVPVDEWICVKFPSREHGRLLRHLVPSGYTEDDAFKLYRVEKNADTETPLSCVMVVMHHLTTHQLELPKECCRIIAHHVHVGLFMDRLTFSGHSMKTPIQIALLKLYRASLMARQSAIPGEAIVEINKGIELQLRQALVDADLMEAANLDVIATVDLASLLNALVPEFANLGAARRVTVLWKQNPNERLIVRGDVSELRVAFGNLLDNAVKYSFSGKEVRIRSHRSHSQITIQIANYGVGFDSDRYNSALLGTPGGRFSPPTERFTRSGSGLGLAHAKELIEKNHGSLSVNYNPVDSTEHFGVVTVKLVFTV